MRALRRLTPLFVLALIAVFVLVSDQLVPSLPILPAGPLTVVSLGDSTISGEGVGDYLPGTTGDGNWCHRSRAAEVEESTVPGVTEKVNLACSGADAAKVGFPGPASQARQLTAIARTNRVVAVVVGVGANDDPRFADVVGKCTEAWFQPGAAGCANTVGGVWRQHVAAMVPKVVAALRDVRVAMRDAGYPEDAYTLVVQSYAAPVGPDVRPGLQNLAGCPFRTADLHWVRDTAVPALSAGLRAAAQDVGARFLDLSRAGTGHEACSGTPADEWFTRLSVNFDLLRDDATADHAMQESFHPNAHGHAQFARCVTDFLATTAPTAACLPDPAGNLHPVAGQAIQASTTG